MVSKRPIKKAAREGKRMTFVLPDMGAGISPVTVGLLGIIYLASIVILWKAYWKANSYYKKWKKDGKLSGPET